MTRVTRAEIDLAALQHNFEIARRAAPHSRNMAIIKANAYGHGMIPVARALARADAFGVACIDEALSLREAGIAQPIVLLEGFTRAADLNLLRGYNLQPVLHHASQLDILAGERGAPLQLWLKLDTGMHRLGFRTEQLPEIRRRLQAMPVSHPLNYLTHLANADDRQDDFTREQLNCFDTALAADEAPRSIANSAGILAWPQAHREWNRPGIMLYGVSPFIAASAAEHGLKPVMTLHSELIAVNHCRAGEPIGYGGDWRCPEDMPIGVVAIGYGDGYPRHAPPGTPVLLKDRRVPLVGRVSMDMLCVDLRSQPQAAIGDAVVLWGAGLPVEEIAAAAGTIAYELLCKVTRRVSFDYREQA